MRKSRILHHFPYEKRFSFLMRRHSIFWHSWHLLFKRVTMQIKSLDMSQTRILNIKILYFESTVLANFIEKPFLFFYMHFNWKPSFFILVMVQKIITDLLCHLAWQFSWSTSKIHKLSKGFLKHYKYLHTCK